MRPRDEVRLYEAAARQLRDAWGEWLRSPDPMPSEELLEAMGHVLELAGLELADPWG